MTLNRILLGAIASTTILLTGCGGSFSGNDFSSRGPATPEPTYYGTPTDIPDADAVDVTMAAKFLYRQLTYVPGASSGNGLGSVIPAVSGAPIPFAEFHIYDSSGARVQQGETNTNGLAIFEMPKTAGTYTLKVFSRSLNYYAKVSVLEDIYTNTPYSIYQVFTISATEISSGVLDLSSTPVYAHGNENSSSKIEGGAFNIMYDILLANEYIRRNIDKNGDVAGVPSADTEKWWVAEKVTIYWKAGFNPYTYFGSSTPLSFYSPGERKLYILGGSGGNVTTADTDHFDDSVILHEYGHFLEDVYGNSQSPGGSHNGNFVIDARLAWSEGWANYFQGAVLTGAANKSSGRNEDLLPLTTKFKYYIDTYGYVGGGGSAGVSIAFNLSGVGDSVSEFDNVASDLAGTGTFRELSVSRTLYKSSRALSEIYSGAKTGGGISFKNFWKVFSGEEKGVSTHANPATYSFANTTSYPVSNMGLFNWMLTKNITAPAPDTAWDDILTEEKQNKVTKDYAHMTTTTGACTFTFTTGAVETAMAGVLRSNPQVNNDFYLYYHNGSATTLSMDYTTGGAKVLDLDLILYKADYIYFEDTYHYAGQSSPYIVKQSRTVASASESVNLSGLPAGFYMLNVKINAYSKLSADLNGSATYKIYKDGDQLCGTEQP